MSWITYCAFCATSISSRTLRAPPKLRWKPVFSCRTPERRERLLIRRSRGSVASDGNMSVKNARLLNATTRHSFALCPQRAMRSEILCQIADIARRSDKWDRRVILDAAGELGLHDRGGLAQPLQLRCAESPIAQCFLSMLTWLRGRPLNLARCAAEARRRPGLNDAIILDERPTMPIVRMFWRL